MVNDIIKFGRVNFKVAVIKSDKLRKSIQGGYDQLEKKNKEINEHLQKMYKQHSTKIKLSTNISSKPNLNVIDTPEANYFNKQKTMMGGDE